MACDQKVGDGIPLRVSPDGCCALRTAHFEANLGRVCVRAETQQDIVIDNIHRVRVQRACCDPCGIRIAPVVGVGS